MRLVLHVVIWSLLLVASGCSDEGGATADTQDAPADSAPPMDTYTGRTISLRLVPFEFLSGDNLQGVEVCVLDTTSCQTSTLEGVVFEVALGHRHLFGMTATGFVDTVYQVPARNLDTGFVPPLFAANLADAAAGIVGVTREPGKAMVVAAASTRGKAGDPGIEGAYFTLEGSSTEGPFYATAQGTLSPDDNVTGARGAGFFFNIDAERALVEIHHPTRSCTVSGPSWAVSDDRPAVADMVLRPDAVSHIQFACPDR